jgi:hypothetical protein
MNWGYAGVIVFAAIIAVGVLTYQPPKSEPVQPASAETASCALGASGVTSSGIEWKVVKC